MKVQNSLLVFVATILMSTTAAAYAGPPVTVTFKNLGDEVANYTIVTVNESSTHATASPKPAPTVNPSNSDTCRVQSNVSANGNAALVRYRMGNRPLGGKECTFSTTYVNMISSGGSMTPQWNKNANASGGAVCTATITSFNFTTHAWAVEFTMR